MVPERRVIFTMRAKGLCLLCNAKLASETCVLPCGHIFCQLCISTFCAGATTCPSCGSTFTRLQKVVDGEPTGFYLSSKALQALYTGAPPSADSPFPEAQKIPESASERQLRHHRKQPLPLVPAPIRAARPTRFAILQLPLVFGRER
jgi:hypothetical protein